jgi:hypothetical protein
VGERERGQVKVPMTEKETKGEEQKSERGKESDREDKERIFCCV